MTTTQSIAAVLHGSEYPLYPSKEISAQAKAAGIVIVYGASDDLMEFDGAFRDEVDRFGPGDLEIADPSVEHQPVAEAGADCICLAATDAPLRFKDFLPRLLQPLFRI